MQLGDCKLSRHQMATCNIAKLACLLCCNLSRRSPRLE